MHRWLTVRGSEWLAARPAGADEDIHMPAALAHHAIEQYSRPGDLVLDPFAGFGTAPITAQRLGRHGLGVEYNPERAELAAAGLAAPDTVVRGDARQLTAAVADLAERTGLDCRGAVDLCLTSPPYMARNDPASNPLTAYSSGTATYDSYLDELEGVFGDVAELIRPGGWLVVHAANLVHDGEVTPLAFDLTRVISRQLRFRGEITVAWNGAPEWMTGDYLLTFCRD
ncbi:MAG TPA: site-specific DNA-methyltransferase [Candidatus Avipropionibacterium avicola]|uniref:Methyltransferase n=1 Tax=Candidatus Avipropionibacterium avicola TaxID=2840701 RepID=A0A9D1GY94_9ACTN|nr:site-specific DNA-methyltransferase [Candidatus Avipropionibacterium avicola]